MELFDREVGGQAAVYRPFPVTRMATICPVTHDQCQRFPATCAEVGCQHRNVRDLPRAPENASHAPDSPRG
jgi:hypothetical protein